MTLCQIIDTRDEDDENRQRALGTFVDFHRNYIGTFICWSVSLPDSYCPDRKTAWAHLPPSGQYRFLRDEYIPKVINEFLSSYYCVFELNKNKNMHCHILGFIPTLYPDLDIREIQQTLKFNPLVKRIVKKGLWIKLNHVVRCTKEDFWQDYLNKDNMVMKYCPIVKTATVGLAQKE